MHANSSFGVTFDRSSSQARRPWRCPVCSVMAPIAVLVVAAVMFVPAAAGLPLVEHAPKDDGSLTVLAVGDWGRRGEYNQTLVAAQMGLVGEKLDADFVITTGDNFYHDGLTGDNDTASFQASFTNIYTADSLQKAEALVHR